MGSKWRLAKLPPVSSRSRHVSRCQTTIAVLLERHQGWCHLQSLCGDRTHVFCQVRSRFPFIKSNPVLTNNFSLLPALAFILDMNHNTGGFYGVNEALFSSALATIVFSIFAAQPLTIVGITGLISLFNYTIYHIIQRYDVFLYPQFMVWVGIWAAIL